MTFVDASVLLLGVLDLVVKDDHRCYPSWSCQGILDLMVIVIRISIVLVVDAVDSKDR